MEISAVGEGLEIEADLVVGEIENQAFSGKIPPIMNVFFVFGIIFPEEDGWEE